MENRDTSENSQVIECAKKDVSHIRRNFEKAKEAYKQARRQLYEADVARVEAEAHLYVATGSRAFEAKELFLGAVEVYRDIKRTCGQAHAAFLTEARAYSMAKVALHKAIVDGYNEAAAQAGEGKQQ